MAYQAVAISVTLSGLQDRAPNAGVLKCDLRTVVHQLTRLQLT